MKTKLTGENMRYKRICLLGFALAGLSLSGCATNRLTRLDDVSSEEAIVVAKFCIKYNGEDVTKGCNVVFNSFALAKNQFILDESGYVFGKLPVGLNSIRILVHKSGLMQHRFRSEELTCQLSGGGVINYIGNITFDWHGMGSGAGVAVVVAGGMIGSTLLTGGDIAVLVESNTAEMQEAFRRKFSTDRNITTSLVVVKLSK
jgi:hypothetical protein